MGINIGALIAPLVVGTLGQEYNYHLGFSVAAVGMFFGLLQYYFKDVNLLLGLVSSTNPMSKEEQKKFAKAFMLAIVVAFTYFGGAYVTGHLTIDFFINTISVLGILLPVYYFSKMLTSKDVTAEEKPKVLAYLPLFLAAIVSGHWKNKVRLFLLYLQMNGRKRVCLASRLPLAGSNH